MRILVTGGAGFIGSHLCDFLVKKGNDVICIDNFFTGSKNNIRHLMENWNFELIRHDIIEPILLEVDQIYHFACPASPIHYQYNPVKTIKTSVMGTINMLGMARRIHSRVMLASTSEVYGDPLQHPQTESYWGNVNPIGIRSCYDEGKRVAETLFVDTHEHLIEEEDRIKGESNRIFNTYGPRMALNDGRVVSNFIVQALQNKNITIYGDGSQTRSFQYIDDLISASYKMMNKQNLIGPVNIGNPDEFSIKYLAEKIIDMIGAKSKIIYKSLPSDDPEKRKPDISLAKNELDWTPKVKLEDGLKETIPYFEKELASNNNNLQ